eukprot:TRINITY_DN17407_c0_g1_i1.p2 TRINITY_DN17407_c0_g1~~TRINITY_DN17407_c0_g1_i1.p2  ORF type:complete len:628 (+),score=209.33 TRINITY_DN17407_c0_g1_i1:92-1975(+)
MAKSPAAAPAAAPACSLAAEPTQCTQLEPTLTMREDGTLPTASPAPEDDDAWGELRQLKGPPVRGEGSAGVFKMRDDSFVVGRGPEHIEISDGRISSRHFKIERIEAPADGSDPDGSGMQVVIIDQSTNGTWVNKHKLTKGGLHRLGNGDEIRLIQHRKPGEVSCSWEYLFLFKTREALSRRATLLANSRSQLVHAPPLRWQRGDLIGRGGFGDVYMGINIGTGGLLAVKTVRLATGMDADKITQEVELLQQLRHPRIVRYVASSAGSEPGTLDIVLEYVPGGSVEKLLGRFGPFRERMIARYTSQILDGLDFLHKHHVIHQDIKAANVLVTVEGACKLSDFGSALRLNSQQSLCRAADARIAGTPLWMAPELIRSHQKGVPSDIWSLGCTVLEMATAKRPWSEKRWENSMTAMLHIATTKAPPDMPTEETSEEMLDFMRLCLKVKVEDRAKSCRELLRHAFITPPPTNPTPGDKRRSQQSAAERVSPFRGGAKRRRTNPREAPDSPRRALSWSEVLHGVKRPEPKEHESQVSPPPSPEEDTPAEEQLHCQFLQGEAGGAEGMICRLREALPRLSGSTGRASDTDCGDVEMDQADEQLCRQQSTLPAGRGSSGMTEEFALMSVAEQP